jgi:hypothetical protein
MHAELDAADAVHVSLLAALLAPRAGTDAEAKRRREPPFRGDDRVLLWAAQP